MGLPVPRSLQETEPNPVKSGLLSARPLEFAQIELGKYMAEYAFKDKDCIVHWFRSAGGLYPQSFRSRLVNAFNAWPGGKTGVEITWEDEMQSFCVIVRGGGEMPPGPDDIQWVLQSVVHGL